MDAVIVLDHKGGGDQPRGDAPQGHAPGNTPGAEYEPGAAHERILDEFRLLLDAVAQRAEEYLGSRAETESNASSPSCGWCPLCTVVSMLRGRRPDLRLVEQVAAVVTVIRQSLDEPHDEPRQPDPPDPAPDTKVQRINIQRVDGRILRGRVGATEGRGC